jgi:hypothetical protein
MCTYLKEPEKFLGLVRRASFAPEMMVYCQNSDSFETFMLNMCPDWMVEEITMTYRNSLNEKNQNMFCYSKLCELV